ncbi:MAG: sensor histidine kinase [Chloroflexota bacterium]
MLILAALGFAIYSIMADNIYSTVDAELQQERQEAQLLVDHSGSVQAAMRLWGPGSGFTMMVADTSFNVDSTSNCPDPMVFPPCLPSQLRPLSLSAMEASAKSPKGSDLRIVQTGNASWRVLSFLSAPIGPSGTSVGPAGIIQIGQLVTGEQSALQEITQWLIVGGLIGVLLAALGSVFLANRALVPIRHAFSRQRQFTADASHELRTPLALIRANAEMLERHVEVLPTEDSELVSEIITETDHLNRLVGDLLTLARADTGALHLTKAPVDLRSLVQEVHEDLRLIAQSRGIQSDLSLDGPVTVQGDRGRLRQLLLILLDNALKYTDEGGKVEVRVESGDNHARLVVADSGVGIPAGDLPHIFDRFYRVDRVREHESGGTGLGLSIASWIVQAHHGNIKVDSAVGQGTRFRVELPTG